jgi:hypothetical protein
VLWWPNSGQEFAGIVSFESDITEKIVWQLSKERYRCLLRTSLRHIQRTLSRVIALVV